MPYAKVNGLNLYYEEAGQHETALVCLHGISSNSRSWRHQLSGLSDTYRVIAWDARGYGRSDDPAEPFAMSAYAHDLAELLDALSLEKAVIVGLSMGGVMAQEFYRYYPQRVLALILADTNTGGGARPEAERRARLEARLKAIETQTPAEIAQQRAPGMLSPDAPPSVLAEVIEMVSEIHPVGYRYAAMALDAADTRAVLPTIAVPTLVLWGDCDTITPRPELETLCAAIPGARLEIIPGAGHLSDFEQPESFSLVVRHFLTQNSE